MPTPGFDFQVYDVEAKEKVAVMPLGTPSRFPVFSPDGSRYAYYESEPDMQPRIIAVRQTDHPQEVLNTYSRWELVPKGWLGGRIEDWHLDNERLLISIQHYIEPTAKMSLLQADLAIFNTTTGHIEQLTDDPDYVAYNARWNTDASTILYQRHNRRDPEDCYCDQIAIYDAFSRETKVLPLIGMNPQWIAPTSNE